MVLHQGRLPLVEMRCLSLSQIQIVKHSLGIDATMVFLGGAALSANYNYYFNGVSDRGLMLGFGVGKLDLFFADSEEEKKDEGYIATLSLGYQF